MEHPKHDTPTIPPGRGDLLSTADVHDLRVLGWRLELYKEVACDPSVAYEELLELNDHIDELPVAAIEHYSTYVDVFTAALDAKRERPHYFREIESSLAARVIIHTHNKDGSVRFKELLSRFFPGKRAPGDPESLKAALQHLRDKGMIIDSNRNTLYLPGMYGSTPYEDPLAAKSELLPDAPDIKPCPVDPSIESKIKQALGKGALAKLPNKLPGKSINNKTRRRGGQSRKRG